jgi:hypothetical protein
MRRSGSLLGAGLGRALSCTLAQAPNIDSSATNANDSPNLCMNIRFHILKTAT